MKLLFAIKALDDIKGGAERVLADVTSGLAERGHEVTILSSDQPGGQSFYPLNPKVKRITPGVGDVTQRASIGDLFARIRMIRKAALKEQPDVVIGFMHSTFVPAAFAMAGTGIPVIASEHIVPAHYKTRRLEYALLLLSALFVKKMTVLSPSIMKAYPRLLHKKMQAVANPVHPAEKMADVKGGERKIILSVGRLTAQKDQATLIKAFAMLAEEFPDWDVRIVGDGELKPDLQSLIATLELENRVFLPGATAKIALEYQQAQLFALPSLYESFGLVTAEAMAHGLPVIGFKSCPGTNEVIKHEHNGLLLEGEDRVDIFTQGLKRLMRDSMYRQTLGHKGPESVKQFAPDVITQAWETLIKETL